MKVSAMNKWCTRPWIYFGLKAIRRYTNCLQTFTFYGKGEVLPNSLNTLGTAAFSLCNKITNVKLSENLKVIPQEAFSYCEAL